MVPGKIDRAEREGSQHDWRSNGYCGIMVHWGRDVSGVEEACDGDSHRWKFGIELVG